MHSQENILRRLALSKFRKKSRKAKQEKQFSKHETLILGIIEVSKLWLSSRYQAAGPFPCPKT